MAEFLETVEQGVEQAVGPFDLAVAQVADALEDRVPVTVAVREEPQDHGRGRRGDQVLGEVHRSTIHRGARYTQGRVAVV